MITFQWEHFPCFYWQRSIEIVLITQIHSKYRWNFHRKQELCKTENDFPKWNSVHKSGIRYTYPIFISNNDVSGTRIKFNLIHILTRYATSAENFFILSHIQQCFAHFIFRYLIEIDHLLVRQCCRRYSSRIFQPIVDAAKFLCRKIQSRIWVDDNRWTPC